MLPPQQHDDDGPEFVAIVLAGSIGTRLFPLTDAHQPKHLLSVAGIPLLHRLLHTLDHAVGFTETIVVIAPEDTVTLASLQNCDGLQRISADSSTSETLATATTATTTRFASSSMRVTVVQQQRQQSSGGTAAAVLSVWSAERPQSHAVVLPGDLVLTDPTVLRQWIHAHRLQQQNNNAACTMLLTDCRDPTSNSVPMKESAKQKKGLYAREEGEREYIAITSSSSSNGGRVVWKQSVLDIVDDGVGGTPRLVLPKARLRHTGTIQVRTDWNDVHCYCFAPWIREALREEFVSSTSNSSNTDATVSPSSSFSLQEDVVPWLLEQQWRGVPKATTADNDAEVQPFSVQAYTVDHAHSVFRSHTVPAYVYANQEVLRCLSVVSKDDNVLLLPPTAGPIHPKFQSLVIDPSTTTIADSVKFQTSVIGPHTRIGAKCGLHHVVCSGSHVTMGNRVTLQSTVLGSHVTIGDGCSLKDCQVGSGCTIPAGTKWKNEAVSKEDQDAEAAAATVSSEVPPP